MPILQRSDLRSFLNQVHFDDPVFVTFTLKQRLKDYGSLTTDRMRQNFRHFSNGLNQRLIGNACRRYGKSLCYRIL